MTINSNKGLINQFKAAWNNSIPFNRYELPKNFDASKSKAAEIAKRAENFFFANLSNCFHAKSLKGRVVNGILLAIAAIIFPISILVAATYSRSIAKKNVKEALATKRLSILKECFSIPHASKEIIADAMKRTVTENRRTFPFKFSRRINSITNNYALFQNILLDEINDKSKLKSETDKWRRIKSGDIFTEASYIPKSENKEDKANTLQLKLNEARESFIVRFQNSQTPLQIELPSKDKISALDIFRRDCMTRGGHPDSKIIMPDSTETTVKYVALENDGLNTDLLSELYKFSNVVANQCELEGLKSELFNYVQFSFTQITSNFISHLMNGIGNTFANDNTLKSLITLKHNERSNTISVTYDFEVGFTHVTTTAGISHQDRVPLSFKVTTTLDLNSLVKEKKLDLAKQLSIECGQYKFIEPSEEQNTLEINSSNPSSSPSSGFSLSSSPGSTSPSSLSSSGAQTPDNDSPKVARVSSSTNPSPESPILIPNNSSDEHTSESDHQ